MYDNNNTSSRIERLEKEKAELASKILRLKNQENESRNKAELRKKILIGSMVMGLMLKNETLKDQITARLDNFLTKNIDRKLFKLPLTKKEQQENSNTF
ncbi:hypothetical protein [Aeromonas dhakensis]|uniref:hypothetical protein n=1 Tax=Aeromonas TaxID=642 RepID=UPI0020B40D08|nr:hypothetical protein [Aeromonas dhakensis]CAD7490126.1 hypothetical protein KBAD45_08890 [Aeromonas dhakensis]CAD7495265.1 hypothetical protein KBAD59_08910 [Aeromonas dhakensis]CAD7495366.1 hypothetical protein KBAD11_08890 [Aeromonas dhakensis]CAD7503236.1 hypothetical protein KBAD14_KBAD14_08900 [Aeromonas dhakensis]CAD7503402.1 hypothetical protein KBAD10_08910 [Aeromonas dhakensis]